MSRLNIQKTYKLFIGGKFPRTESGRSYSIENDKVALIANMCHASRKDFRNSVVVARKAQAGWAGKTAFNRSQILYRLAEMLEARSASFSEEIQLLGSSKSDADKEVVDAIDTLVYYAGWCDKYTALFSSVNPTASAHFNFTVHEPTGVVAAVAPEQNGLLGLVQIIAPIICGGNTTVVLASNTMGTSAISFAEVVQNSDVPGGVINILTGVMSELTPHMASHMDVNALVIARIGLSDESRDAVIENVKRFADWSTSEVDSNPYRILDFQEAKSTWHPVQTSTGGVSGY
ncbi:MAG: aldehyde dehydrogenase family protein [Bacteroidetes bacterium]|nr:aldehyde dehydrogenase family protein [Bacteroidota bacterium]